MTKLTNVGGGTGWTGATTCVSGYTCTYSNPYYSQCLPGSNAGEFLKRLYKSRVGDEMN